MRMPCTTQHPMMLLPSSASYIPFGPSVVFLSLEESDADVLIRSGHQHLFSAFWSAESLQSSMTMPWETSWKSTAAPIYRCKYKHLGSQQTSILFMCWKFYTLQVLLKYIRYCFSQIVTLLWCRGKEHKKIFWFAFTQLLCPLPIVLPVSRSHYSIPCFNWNRFTSSSLYMSVSTHLWISVLFYLK